MVDFGKIPPQAIDLEQAVLGACMLEKEAVGKALAFLTKDSFYRNSNQLIFEAIAQIHNSGNPVDILTVSEHLRKSGKMDSVGGELAVTDLTNRVASGANIETHALIVAQKFIQREIIRISSEAIKESYNDTTDVLELLDGLSLQLIRVTSQITKHSAKHISGAAKDNMLKIESLSKDSDKLLGYSTGIDSLDKMIHGIQPGVIVIAARPSMGKSALMGQIITSIASQGVPCQVFTLEVSAGKYELRMKSQISKINFERIQTGNIYREEWEKLSEATYAISELPIWIDDSATLSMVQLRSKCLQAYTERGVRCFALDFIQLTEGGTENEALSEMSRVIKIISQELKVPFIELSQLSREVEKRTDKKPMLSDLRNSGSLEQDADIVMLLYRPEYYQLNAYDKDHNQVDNKGFAQIRVAKNKDGKVGTVDLKFIGENLTFKNYNDESPF